MSRIGKMPVSVPSGVSIEINGNRVTVKGPKGTLSQQFPAGMTFEQEGSVLLVQRQSDSRQHRAAHGLTRALLNNMVLGVSKGFTKTLEIEGVGYRAEMQGSTLVLNVGYSHPILFEPPQGIQYAVENRNKTIVVSGIDKQLIGELAARIRRTRPPEPYKGKGIRYTREVVRRKAGKTGKV